MWGWLNPSSEGWQTLCKICIHCGTSCLTFGNWTKCYSKNMPRPTRAHPPHQHPTTTLEQVTGSHHMHAACLTAGNSIMRFIACEVVGWATWSPFLGGGGWARSSARSSLCARCVCLVISDVGAFYVMCWCFPLSHNTVLQIPSPCCRVTVSYPRFQLISHVDDSWPCDTVTVAPSCRGNLRRNMQ